MTTPQAITTAIHSTQTLLETFANLADRSAIQRGFTQLATGASGQAQFVYVGNRPSIPVGAYGKISLLGMDVFGTIAEVGAASPQLQASSYAGINIYHAATTVNVEKSPYFDASCSIPPIGTIAEASYKTTTYSSRKKDRALVLELPSVKQVTLERNLDAVLAMAEKSIRRNRELQRKCIADDYVLVIGVMDCVAPGVLVVKQAEDSKSTEKQEIRIGVNIPFGPGIGVGLSSASTTINSGSCSSVVSTNFSVGCTVAVQVVNLTPDLVDTLSDLAGVPEERVHQLMPILIAKGWRPAWISSKPPGFAAGLRPLQPQDLVKFRSVASPIANVPRPTDEDDEASHVEAKRVAYGPVQFGPMAVPRF